MKSDGASRFSLWGLIEACGVCVVACTLAGFFGGMHWLLELTTHFRVQYLVLLAVMSGLMFFGRRKRIAVLYLSCAMLNAVVVAPWLIPASKTKPEGDSLRLMVLNVHTANTRHDLVLEEIHRVKPDVLLLMEVDSAWEQALQGLVEILPHHVIEPREDNFGIALFSRLPLKTPQVVDWTGDSGVPSITAVVEVSKQSLFFVGTHPVPPASEGNSRLRNEQLEKIAQSVSQQKLPVVVAGDLNATPWSPHFRKFEKAAMLKDTGRRSGWRPTWPAVFPPLWIPLDHCLVSKEFLYASRTVGKSVGSDHYPIIVDIVLPMQ